MRQFARKKGTMSKKPRQTFSRPRVKRKISSERVLIVTEGKKIEP